MPTLTVARDVHLYYEDVGAGPAVVLTHGWLLTRRGWDAQVRDLVEAGHRVVTYDRRGFGDSSQPWDGYDYDTFADDLAALIQHLALDRLTLIGASSGGGDVTRYLTRHGTGKVQRAVFSGTTTPAVGVSPDNPAGSIDAATLNEMVQSCRTHRMSFISEMLHRAFTAEGQLAVDDPTLRYAVQVAAQASAKGTADTLTAIATTDFRTELATIDLPCLVIHGGSDAIVPHELSGHRTHALLRNCVEAIIPSGPHCIAVTHPEQWNGVVLEFLRRGQRKAPPR
jgi:non-heme chloroperoxidase